MWHKKNALVSTYEVFVFELNIAIQEQNLDL